MSDGLIFALADAMRRRDAEVYYADYGYDFYLEMANAAAEAYETYRARQELKGSYR